MDDQHNNSIDHIPAPLRSALYHGEEEVYLEYKGDVSWTDRKKKLEIIQTVFAMANESEGGIIVLGVKNDGTQIGLSEDNYKTFSHDVVNQKIENQGNQSVSCKVSKFQVKDGAGEVKRFVFIQVRECREFPLVYTGGQQLGDPSREAYSSNIMLRHGALYIRCKTSVGNKEIETIQEWQDIIERTYRKYERETLHRQSVLGAITNEKNPFDNELTI